MKFRPVSDNILVKRTEPLEKSKGGIFIPASAQEKNTRGVVVAAGRGRTAESGRFVETTVKPGESVQFDKYAGTDIKIDGEDYVILPEPVIQGVIED